MRKRRECSALYLTIFQVTLLSNHLFASTDFNLLVTGFPSDDTIIHDELLKPDGLCINSTHGLLICMPCASIVDILHIPVHFSRPAHVKKPKPARDLGERLRCKFPFLKYPPIHPAMAVLLIFGLKAPLPDYFVCQQCSHGYRSHDSFKSHKCSGSGAYYKSHVQTFGHGTQDVYFPVKPSEPPRLQSTAEVLFQSYVGDMQNRPDFNTIVTVPHNYRELSQFLAKERWLELVKNKDIVHLQALVAPPTNSEPWPILHRHVCAFLVKSQDKIALNALHSVRRLLGTRPSYVLFIDLLYICPYHFFFFF